MSLFDFLEPEEWVGGHWHRLVGGAHSYPRHPEAAVALDSLRGVLAVFFRGLGGEKGVQVAAGGGAESGHRLTLRQHLGMDAERLDRATLDGDSLLLPKAIDLFPDAALNRDLYLWLAAFFAHLEPPRVAPDDPLAADLAALAAARAATERALAAAPGLVGRYGRLADALLALRPARRLPRWEAAVEGCLQAVLTRAAPEGDDALALWPAVLGGSARLPKAPGKYRPFLPVPLWGARLDRRASGARPDDAETGGGSDGEQDSDDHRRRSRRENLDQAQREDSLILNNMEKILGLAEALNLNRAVDDDDEDNARKAADDLDEIVVSRHQKKAATKLKLDLDLPPDAVAGEALKARCTYPEWDYTRGAYRPDFCSVIPQVATEEGEDWKPDLEGRRRIARVRRQFEALRPKRVTLHRQMDGNDLDMDALVRSRCDLAASGQASARLYTDVRNDARDLAVALLVDVSLSTDAWIENRRVLDVEKEALLTLSSGLAAVGDDHAIYAFTSRKRDFVRLDTVKAFDERLGGAVMRRISALKPGYYTRIGPAVRHVTRELIGRPNRHRLLLVLTDGKPNDIDHYEGRYGIEDTRVAVREARRAGVAVFGVTVDRQAQDYFPHIFGRGSYHIVAHAATLSSALPKIYRQLVA